MEIFSCSSKLILQKVDDPNNLKEYQCHKGIISDLTISENQRVVASCGYDGSIYLCNVETQNILQQFRQKQQINSICFNKGSEMLATGNEYSIVVYDIKKKKLFYEEDLDSNVNQVVFNKQDQNELMGTCTSDGDCYLYFKENDYLKQLQTIQQQVGIECLQFNKQHKNVLVQGLENGIIDVFDINQRKRMFESSQRHQKKVNSILFSPYKSAFMMSVSDDQFIKFHDINSNKFIKQIYIEDQLLCADFHNNGHSIVVGTQNGSVLVYDLRKDINRLLIHQHPQSVNQVQFLYSNQAQSRENIKPNTQQQNNTPKVKSSRSNSFIKTIPQNSNSQQNYEKQKYTEKENNLEKEQLVNQINDKVVVSVDKPTVQINKGTVQSDLANISIQNRFSEEQKQYIQSVVERNKEELQEQMEESFKNLHLEMIRQFQIQCNQMAGIIQEQLEQQDQLEQKNEQLEAQLALIQKQPFQ